MPTQNDPGQQTPIRQAAYPAPDPKSAARTPSPLDDVTPPADPNKGPGWLLQEVRRVAHRLDRAEEFARMPVSPAQELQEGGRPTKWSPGLGNGTAPVKTGVVPWPDAKLPPTPSRNLPSTTHCRSMPTQNDPGQQTPIRQAAY